MKPLDTHFSLYNEKIRLIFKCKLMDVPPLIDFAIDNISKYYSNGSKPDLKLPSFGTFISLINIWKLIKSYKEISIILR